MSQPLVLPEMIASMRAGFAPVSTQPSFVTFCRYIGATTAALYYPRREDGEAENVNALRFRDQRFRGSRLLAFRFYHPQHEPIHL